MAPLFVIRRSALPRPPSIYKPLLFGCSLLSLAMAQLSCPGFSSVSEKVLETKLNAAKILLPGSRFTVTTGSIEVTVSKFVTEGSKDIDKDSKIEAVMIAKTIMDADPSVKRVKTQFFDRSAPTEFHSITVGIGDVKAFGSGAISGVDLMNSLESVKGSTPNPPLGSPETSSKPVDAASVSNAPGEEADASLVVAEGVLADERKKLLGRINQLKKNSVNTSAYESYFAQIEETAKTNSKTATLDMIQKLSLNIESQEKALERKKAPVAVSAVSSSKSSLPLPPGVGDAAPEEPPVRSGAGYSLDDLTGLFMGAIAQRASILQLIPSPGPFQDERGALVRRWYILGKADKILFHELENDARMKNTAALAEKLKVAFRKYQVSSADMQVAKAYFANKGRIPWGAGWGEPGGHHRHQHRHR